MIEAFHIGVALDMQSNAAAVLSGVNREILGVHQGVGRATAALGQFRLAFAGLGAMTVGGGIPAFMRHMETPGEGLPQSQAAPPSALGGTAAGQDQMPEATREVRGANPDAIRDLRGVFGDLRQAMIMLPQLHRGDGRRAPSREMADGGGAAAFLAAGHGAEVAEVWRNALRHAAEWQSALRHSALGKRNEARAGEPVRAAGMTPADERAASGRMTSASAAVAGQFRAEAPGISLHAMQATTARGLGTPTPALAAQAPNGDVARVVERVFTDPSLIIALKEGRAISQAAPDRHTAGDDADLAETWRNALRHSTVPGPATDAAGDGADLAETWRNALPQAAVRGPPTDAAFATPHDEHDDAPRGAVSPQAPKTDADPNASPGSHPDSAPFIIVMDGREIARGLARRADGALTGTGSFDGRRNMLATT